MKFKASEKFVILETAIYSEKVFKQGEVWMLGEICHTNYIGQNQNVVNRLSIIEERGPDYLIELPDDKIEEIYKKIKPLSLVRQERIDEILS
jgi:RecB family endonuclease NucS